MKIITVDDSVSKKPSRQSDRITGDMLSSFKTKNNLSPRQIADIMGVGVNSVLRELERGNEGVESREICFMYRIFTKHPELLEQEIEIRDFYDAIGGEDMVSGPMFSLVLGKEQSAYARYFENSNQSSSKSAKRMINQALRVSGNDPAVAYNFMVEIALEESWSRGFNIFQERTWNPLYNKFGKSRSHARFEKEKKNLLLLKTKRTKKRSQKNKNGMESVVAPDNIDEQNQNGTVPITANLTSGGSE